MAATALSRRRGPASDRATKGLFLIFSLLYLFHFAISLNMKEQLEILKAGLEEQSRQKAEDSYRNATFAKLFDLSNSLTNKEQLELFRETLRKAVKQAERLKAENKYKLAIGSEELDQKLMSLRYQIQLLEIFSGSYPLVGDIANFLTRLLKNVRTYLHKKTALLQE